MSYNPNDGSVYTKYQLIELLAPHKLRATCSIRITCISMTKYELLALHNQFINGAKDLLLKTYLPKFSYSPPNPIRCT